MLLDITIAQADERVAYIAIIMFRILFGQFLKYLSTHPHSADRVKRIDALIEEKGYEKRAPAKIPPKDAGEETKPEIEPAP